MEAAQAFFDGKYDEVKDDDETMEDTPTAKSAKRLGLSRLEVFHSHHAPPCLSTIFSSSRPLLMKVVMMMKNSKMMEMSKISQITTQTPNSRHNLRVALGLALIHTQVRLC